MNCVDRYWWWCSRDVVNDVDSEDIDNIFFVYGRYGGHSDFVAVDPDIKIDTSRTRTVVVTVIRMKIRGTGLLPPSNLVVEVALWLPTCHYTPLSGIYEPAVIDCDVAARRGRDKVVLTVETIATEGMFSCISITVSPGMTTVHITPEYMKRWRVMGVVIRRGETWMLCCE